MKIKFTSRVRRGLGLVRHIALASVDQDKPPTETIMSRWTKLQRGDYELALRWIEEQQELPEKAGHDH